MIVDEFSQEEIDAVLRAPKDARTVLHLRFLHMLIEDSSIHDEMPAEAFVFLLPEDDPELAAEEREAAERYAQAGRTVYVRSMPPAPKPSATDSPPKS